MRVEYSADVPVVEGVVMPTSGLISVRCPFCKGMHFHTDASRPARSFCAEPARRGYYRIVKLRTATHPEGVAIRREAQ